MNLYVLNEQYESVTALLDECSEPEDFDAVLNQLSELGMARDKKIENTGKLIKSVNAMTVAIKAEEKELSERRKKHERKLEAISNWLEYNMNGETFESASVCITWRKSEIVEVLVPYNELPSNCIRTKTTHEPDKSIIKDQLKKGVEIAGCHLVVKQNMQVK